MKEKVPPRIVPFRDDYYMGIALWVASRSKDPRTQVGAVIISEKNEPLASGYNGPPAQVKDTAVDWDRPEKYDWVIHAEDNAIKHVGNKRRLRGATLYVTARPCKACMLDMVAVGIKRVIYLTPKADANSLLANEAAWGIAQEIASEGSLELISFHGNLSWMQDRLKWMESLGIFS